MEARTREARVTLSREGGERVAKKIGEEAFCQ